MKRMTIQWLRSKIAVSWLIGAFVGVAALSYAVYEWRAEMLQVSWKLVSRLHRKAT